MVKVRIYQIKQLTMETFMNNRFNTQFSSFSANLTDKHVQITIPTTNEVEYNLWMFQDFLAKALSICYFRCTIWEQVNLAFWIDTVAGKPNGEHICWPFYLSFWKTSQRSYNFGLDFCIFIKNYKHKKLQTQISPVLQSSKWYYM